MLTLKDLVPLLSTLIGGVLAVGGGFVASYYLQAASRRLDRNQIIREKLEEAYLLTLQLNAWLQSQMGTMIVPSSKDNKEIESPTGKLVMLTRCYNRKSAVTVITLSQSVEAFREASFEYWRRTLELNKRRDMNSWQKISAEEFKELLGIPFEDARASCEQLCVELEEAIGKHI